MKKIIIDITKDNSFQNFYKEFYNKTNGYSVKGFDNCPKLGYGGKNLAEYLKLLKNKNWHIIIKGKNIKPFMKINRFSSVEEFDDFKWSIIVRELTKFSNENTKSFVEFVA